MSEKNNKFVEKLKQIKRRQESMLEEIDELKQTADENQIADLEQIENTGFRFIIEIDDATRKYNQSLADAIERRTILFRMRDRDKPTERIAGIRI